MKKIASFRRSKSHEPSGQFTLPRKPQAKVDHSSYHHATIPRVASSGDSKQRPGLSNLNFGNEEIRKSIDALDHILDEFDDESGISQGSDESLRNQTNAPGSGDAAEQAARMIAAQLADGRGSLRLKKTSFSKYLEDDDLPPPPPELLQPNARPSVLNVEKSTPASPPANKELYARHKRPPAVPKRSPETKLSTSEIQARELAEIDGALPPPDYDDDEQAPESGYITPEQQGSELEYPLLSQARPPQSVRDSPRGSVSSGQSPQHANNPYTTRIQAEVHANYQNSDHTGTANVNAFQNNRGSVVSLGSIPALPPPPPPADAMALQMNPLHRASGKPLSIASASTLISSDSSSGTLHDPYQQDDLYDHFIPPTEHSQNTWSQQAYGATLSAGGTYGGNIYDHESSLYERTLPIPNNQNVPKVNGFSSRPLPAPPGGGGNSQTMNYPGRNSMPSMGAMTMPNPNRSSSGQLPHLEAFPPPPPQFANQNTSTSPHHTTQNSIPKTSPQQSSQIVEAGVDTSSAINSLPFPVKLRPIRSPLLRRSNDANQDNVYRDNLLNTVVPPPSQKLNGATLRPKTSPGDVPPPPMVTSLSAISPLSPHYPPPPPVAEPEYAEVSDIPPPPPMLPQGGMSTDLATRVQQWTISNNERSARPCSQQPDAHSALINQIQTGIKLRKSVFSNRLFDSTREETSQQSTNFGPSADYTYSDSIETCSIISGGSSSSGCHSNSSYSNSTTGSLPPQTLPKPKAEVKNKFGTNIMSENSSNTDPGQIITDVTQLPGYQTIPPDCPTWKTAMIEKKNQQLEAETKKKMMAKYEEEGRWKHIPDWKKNLMLEKEKQKKGVNAVLDADRLKREEENIRLQSLPEWKRDLIIKKRGDL